MPELSAPAHSLVDGAKAATRPKASDNPSVSKPSIGDAPAASPTVTADSADAANLSAVDADEAFQLNAVGHLNESEFPIGEAQAATPTGTADTSRFPIVSSWSGKFDQPLISRFAPSPTGRMHAGNIYASLVAWLLAKASGGEVVLRIEDLDRERSKQRFIDQVQRDYEKLGLTWDRGPYFQHNRDDAYAEAFESLREQGLLYECFCTRADLHAASAPHRGEKLVYPGTCRNLTEEQRREKRRVRKSAIRLRVPDERIGLDDLVQGRYVQELADECGDFIVRRSDGEFAYQLAVVVDDAAQGVNCIARGVDLLCSTPQQLYLQQLLGYPHPRYAHVPLLVAREGRRLSKRDHDAALDTLLATYETPAGVIGHIAGVTGLAETDEPATPDELLKAFDPVRLKTCFSDNVQILWR